MVVMMVVLRTGHPTGTDHTRRAPARVMFTAAGGPTVQLGTAAAGGSAAGHHANVC
jgi:hypothetical protein